LIEFLKKSGVDYNESPLDWRQKNGACTPTGVPWLFEPFSGGVATLNHRLP